MKSFRNFLLLVGILVSVSARAQEIDYANPKEYTIGGITITGTKNLDNDILITISKLQVGQKVRVPGAEITDAVKALMAQNLFSDVSISPLEIKQDTIFLEIALEEQDRMAQLIFQGAKSTEVKDLKERFEAMTGRPVNESLLTRIRNMAKDHYAEKGYLFAEVNARPRRDTSRQGYANVVVTVDRKNKVRVNQITFEGNEEIPRRKLKKFMKNTKQRAFWKIFGSKKFVQEKYREDKQTLLEKYRERGFRDVRIVEDTVYRNSDKDVNVEIAFREGKKYYFGNITWAGNARYPDQVLSQRLQIEKGDTYDEARMNTRLTGGAMNSDDVASLYQNNGYLFANITPVPTDIRGDTIDLEMRVYEGEQATINRVNVTGNDRTNDKVIYRELYTVPGQKYSQADLVRTLNELRGMGYFNEEKLIPDIQPDQEKGTVDIEYQVEERPSDQIQLSGGFGGGMIIGTVGLQFNNFSARKLFEGNWNGILPSGDGQKVGIQMQTNGKYFQNYNISFSEPWFGGRRRQRLTVGFFYSKQTNYNYYNSQIDPNYSADRLLAMTGVNVGIERRLKVPDDYFSLSTTLSFDRYKLNNWWSGSFVFNTGTAHTFSITERLSRNSLNHPIFPTAGSNVSLSVQFTPPYSLLNGKDYSDPDMTPQEIFRLTEFHKWKFNSQFFTTVYGKLVMKAQADFGFLGRYNQDRPLSPFQRFLLGGSGMQQFFNLNAAEIIGMRGYNDGMVLPRDGNERIGAPIYNKYTLELRYPVSLESSANIFVLGFAEGGNTWSAFRDFNPFNVKRSAGVGVRVFLPIFGLLGLDYGVGFDSIPGVSDDRAKQNFQFTINQAF